MTQGVLDLMDVADLMDLRVLTDLKVSGQQEVQDRISQNGTNQTDTHTEIYDEVDADWMQQVAVGSVFAFEHIYARYSPLAYRVALRMMCDPAEAEDVCHDVMLEVWEKAGQYDSSRGAVGSWIAVKTRSRCLDRLRQRRRSYAVDYQEGMVIAGDSSDVAGLDLIGAVVNRWERQWLREALKRIPPRQSAALIEHYSNDRTYSELADMMQCPLGTVKSLIRCGLRNVRKAMRECVWGGA